MYYMNELYHHGIKGQKWGVRRYQNPDGSLTAAGRKRLGKQASKLEKKAIKAHKGKGYDMFSTGENYDAVQKKYSDRWNNDKKRIELSKNAHDIEKKRLMAEKAYIDDDRKYDKYINSKEAMDLDNKSQAATEAKEAYATKIGNEWMKDYEREIRTAKLKDIGMGDYIKDGKDLISSKSGGYMGWDDNLDWNPDNYYDNWVDDRKFKRNLD